MQIQTKVKVISCPEYVPLWQRKLLVGYIFRVKEIVETTTETVYSLSEPFIVMFSKEHLKEVE